MKISVFLMGLLMSSAVLAKPALFDPYSYQQLIDKHQTENFIILLWSLDCSPCIEELPVIAAFHNLNPDVKIFMISTDETTRSEEVMNVITHNQLDTIPQWIFSTGAYQKISYSIDPRWYGELPRSYFFLAGKKSTAKSGRLQAADFSHWLISGDQLNQADAAKADLVNKETKKDNR